MQRPKIGIGALAVILSSVLFGITPIFARITYENGNNSINMVFLRALISMPFLLGLMGARRIPLRPTKQEARYLLAGGLFSVSTALLLYSSYSYIDVGIATTLHFSYPLIVVCLSALLFKERLTPATMVALCFGLAGIIILADFGSSLSLAGILLSALSALTFACKVLLLGRPILKGMPGVKVILYFSLVEALVSLAAGLPTGKISFAFAPSIWLYILLIAVLVSVIAFPCLAFGISRVGPSTASILSTLEPITSILFSVLLLGESVTARKLAGCCLIFAAVLAVLNLPLRRPPRRKP